MRFIVDFYRYVIFAGLAAMIAGLVALTLTLFGRGGFASDLSPYVFFGGIGLLVFFVMSLGMVATFISLHDRHAELVEELIAIRQHMGSQETA